MDLAYVIFKVKFTTNNIGLNYCVHAHPVRQVVARLKAVRVVQWHRGVERSVRIVRAASSEHPGYRQSDPVTITVTQFIRY